MMKYPKLLRIPYDHISIPFGKRSHPNYKKLFKKDFYLTEKLDGSQIAIGFKNGQPYLQARNSHIDQSDKRKAFHGVWQWIWDNISKVEEFKGHLVFGEWMKVMHNLPYDNLPDWFIAFDVWDMKANKFLPFWKVQEFCGDLGIETAPILFDPDVFSVKPPTYEDLPNWIVGSSCFATSEKLIDLDFSEEELKQIKYSRISGERFKDNIIQMEGCVLKNANPKYHKEKKSIYWENCAKFVLQEFVDEMDLDTHWTSHRIRFNKLEWMRS